MQAFTNRLAMGETYFAKKLLDYELSSNNGNWQWSAGTGCDAAPILEYLIQVNRLKNLTNKILISING